MLRLKKTKLNVLVHFFNEEFLLPHWMQHHVGLFDHGIMVNYASTDRSVEIIKQYAPHWQIVDSKNAQFDAELCDAEMMRYEETVEGWKMVLNITEFLFVADLRAKLKEVERAKLDMVRFHGFQINDSIAEKEQRNFDPNRQLLLQRFNGFSDPWRHRIIHKRTNGSYYVGRHFNTPGLKQNPAVKESIKEIPFFEGLYLFWYRFAPYYEQIPRKTQISARVPDSDKKKGYGWNHWDLTEQKIFERWQMENSKCYNILDDPQIAAEFEKIKRLY